MCDPCQSLPVSRSIENNVESTVQLAIKEVSAFLGLKLKDKQLEAALSFCMGQDVFVSLPTGYGKSMIYGILPLVFNKIKGEVIYYCIWILYLFRCQR